MAGCPGCHAGTGTGDPEARHVGLVSCPRSFGPWADRTRRHLIRIFLRHLRLYRDQIWPDNNAPLRRTGLPAGAWGGVLLFALAKTYCSGGLYGEDGDFLVWILGADHRDWSAGDHLSGL